MTSEALQGRWNKLPGLATHIATGWSFQWCIGTNPVGGGNFGFFKLFGDSWIAVDGGAVRIALAGVAEVPWIVTAAGNILRRDGPDWQQMPGRAREIAAGGGSDVWIIGTNSVGNGDFGIYRWNGSDWQVVDGGAVRIAVGLTADETWVVNAAGHIFRRPSVLDAGGGWTQVPGSAQDVAVQADPGGVSTVPVGVWKIGTTPVDNGDFDISGWTGADTHEWLPIDGGGVRIAVQSNLLPWVLNARGEMFARIKQP